MSNLGNEITKNIYLIIEIILLIILLIIFFIHLDDNEKKKFSPSIMSVLKNSDLDLNRELIPLKK